MIVLLLACRTPTPVATEPPTPVLLEGPEITSEIPEGPLLPGASPEIRASASDPDGVDGLELHVRREGELAWTRVEMTADGDVWTAPVPPDVVAAPGIAYWIRAYDASDWRVAATWPERGPDDPVTLAVLPDSVDTPFEEPFSGTTNAAYGLYELDWRSTALGFRGNRWRIGSDGQGDFAHHREGYPGVGGFDDWLVGPTLSLEGESSAEVRWRERGGDGEPGRHSLWVSTGSPLPEDGDFVEVAVLDPPTTRWRPAPVVDLSDWTDDRLTLAWRLEGEEHASWSIDDVRVGPYGPDLRVVEVVRPFVEPGDTGLLQVTVENRGARSGPATVRARALDGWLGFNEALPIEPLGSGETVELELPFAVAGQQADNTVVDGDLLLTTDGVETRWPFDLLVGHPTTGIVRLETTEQDTLDVRVGTGDPRAPHVEEAVFQGVIPPGYHSFEVDLGDHVAYLPSEPGRLRWWVQIRSQHTTRLLGFGIDFDGTVTWTTGGGLLDPLTDTLVYLPHRPAPTITDVQPVDPPLVPGVPGRVRVGLRNDGGSTLGTTRLWPRSADPDLEVPSVPTLLDPARWPAAAETTVEVPITIDATHTDSTPVELVLEVVDDAESFTLTTPVPVPWPELNAGSVLVGGDGVLDPGATSDVLVTLRNDGALDPGSATCTVVSPGPGATVTGGPTVLTTLPAGTVVLLPVSVAVNGGAAGDELPLEVTCTGPLGTWVRTTSVDLGGPPWIGLPLDPAHDAQNGAPLDLREVRWRHDAGEIDLEIRSAGEPDLPVNLEIWMDNEGSSWHNHVVTVGPSGAVLFGVRQQGWTQLSVPDVQVDGERVRLSLQTTTMGLAEPSLAVAMGTGFCSVGFHCDQWPDGWGNPYITPIDTSAWPVLDW